MKLKSIAIALILVMLLAACNLSAGGAPTATPTPEEITPEGTATPTRTVTPQATATPTRTPTSTIQPTAIIPPCTPRTDWPTYTVQAGDTLFRIAQWASSNVSQLTQANCLSDPSNLVTGQRLYVPNPVIRPTATLASEQMLEIYEIVAGDNGNSGPGVGCGDGAVLQRIPIAQSNNATQNLQQAFAFLGTRNASPTSNSGGNGFYYPLTGSNISVTSASIAGSTANVSLSADVSLLGTCFDAAYEAQIVLNVLHLMQVNNASIMLNGQNLRSYIDMSGNSDPNYVYTRQSVDLSPL